MKVMIGGFLILLLLCLFAFSGPCPAKPLTPIPSPQTSICDSASDEAILAALATRPPIPFTSEEPTEDIEAALESTASFSPTVTSGSISHDRSPVQVAIANIPPPQEPSKLEESAGTIADPFQPVNRAFFQFNDKFYFWVLKPVATGYNTVVPEDARVGVHNFFSNLATPVRLVNCLLQFNLKCVGTETFRFLLNSTFGLAGFLDPAKKEFNVGKQDKDLGQTLGVWGIGPAFYINWPILGPSSLRDTVGYVGDLFLDPLTYLNISVFINVGVRAYAQVNEASLTIGEYESLKESAVDPYIAVKDAYHQYRQNKISSKSPSKSP
jgi:phospholipid-binding lipoprotein MlaA